MLNKIQIMVKWCNRVSLGWIIRNFYLGMGSIKGMASETLQKFFHFFKTVINLFKAFKVFAPCLKNEAVNQLKANFIYWKAIRVSLDYTHRLAYPHHLYGL